MGEGISSAISSCDISWLAAARQVKECIYTVRECEEHRRKKHIRGKEKSW